MGGMRFLWGARGFFGVYEGFAWAKGQLGGHQWPLPPAEMPGPELSPPLAGCCGEQDALLPGSPSAGQPQLGGWCHLLASPTPPQQGPRTHLCKGPELISCTGRETEAQSSGNDGP